MPFGPVTVWASGPIELLSALEGDLETCRARFAAFVGADVAVDRPIRVLCFAKREMFLAYCGRLHVNVGDLDGFYQSGRPARLILAAGTYGCCNACPVAATTCSRATSRATPGGRRRPSAPSR